MRLDFTINDEFGEFEAVSHIESDGTIKALHSFANGLPENNSYMRIVGKLHGNWTRVRLTVISAAKVDLFSEVLCHRITVLHEWYYPKANPLEHRTKLKSEEALNVEAKDEKQN